MYRVSAFTCIHATATTIVIGRSLSSVVVTFVYCDKMSEARIMQFSLIHDKVTGIEIKHVVEMIGISVSCLYACGYIAHLCVCRAKTLNRS